jgi:hypothetical protein
MLTFLFAILMVGVFGKMIGFAFRAAWGLTKVLVDLVLLPIVLIVLVFAGFLYIAFPLLIIAGIIMLVKDALS